MSVPTHAHWGMKIFNAPDKHLRPEFLCCGPIDGPTCPSIHHNSKAIIFDRGHRALRIEQGVLGRSPAVKHPIQRVLPSLI